MSEGGWGLLLSTQTQHKSLEEWPSPGCLILGRNLPSAAWGSDPRWSGTRSSEQRCLGVEEEEEEELGDWECVGG